MKAINCTQCGATIENVSELSLIIACDYCGARIMLSAPEQKPKPVISVDPPQLQIDAPKTLSPVNLVLVGGIALLLPLLFLFFSFSDGGTKSSKSDVQSGYATPYPDPTLLPIWTSAANTAPKPVPVVNYQPRVSWDGPNDIEHFDEPQVDISTVSHLTSEEVKNTVFKDRTVKLRVVINTEGEIDTVETVSGHPILVEAATASAKRSIFRSRSKPTTRVLIYTFRVLKD
jgi:DNA-directed RNA polymerase subunit RPC12/RpoP